MAHKSLSTKAKGYLLSLLIILSVIGIWHTATLPKQITAPTDPLRLEYRILMGDIPEFTKPGAIVAIQKANFQAQQSLLRLHGCISLTHFMTRD